MARIHHDRGERSTKGSVDRRPRRRPAVPSATSMSADLPTVPNLLGIGAMKAGTRSFYELLRRTPGTAVTLDHEPAVLSSSPDRATALRQYGQQFPGRRAEATVRAELSTAYAKRPRVEGVADRAHDWLGEATDVVYLVRDPIDRMRSQVRHQMATGSIAQMPWADVLRAHPEVVSYSRYEYQLEPWRTRFRDRVHIILLDDLVAHPDRIMRALFDAIGQPRPVAAAPSLPRLNTADDVRSVPSWLHRAARNPTYRRLVRPVIPSDLLRRLRKGVGTVAGEPLDDFDADAHPEITARLRQEFDAVLGDPARLRP